MMIQKGKYKHFKGNFYEVLYNAKHSETLEEMVVYKALYNEGGIWVRPSIMWSETVISPSSGEKVLRFTKCDDDLSLKKEQ